MVILVLKKWSTKCETIRFWTPFWNVAWCAMVILVLEKLPKHVKTYDFGYHFETLHEMQWLFWCSKSDQKSESCVFFDTILKRCMRCNGYFGARKVIENVRTTFFGHHFETLHEVQWLFWCSKSNRKIRILKRCMRCNGYFWCSKSDQNFQVVFLTFYVFWTPFWNVAGGAMVILVLEK